MKKALISLIFSGIFMLFCLQVFSQEVIATAGGYYEGENFSVSWTLGEPVTETFTGADVILTQGFQQPYSFYFHQILTIPAGWSGVSSYVDPMNKGVEDIFAPYVDDFVILASLSGYYYPATSVNTIGNWSTETGYKIKTLDEIELTLTGVLEDDKTIEMDAGWNLVPVISSCNVSTSAVFGGIPELEIVKEVAGPRVFWPAYGINTLDELLPGNAYFIAASAEASFTYPECSKSSTIIPQEKPRNFTPWNNLHYTASSHAIAFPAAVLRDADIQPGDYIGVFTPEGDCAGRIEIDEITSNKALIAFANDLTTSGKDGFEYGEMLQFKLYRPADDEEIILEVEFNPEMPQQGIFADNGLSSVKSITLEQYGVSEIEDIRIEIYPNPSHGVFYLTMSFWPKDLRFEILNTKGQVLLTKKPGQKLNGSACRIDLSEMEPGVYFIRLWNNSFTEMRKIIIN